MSTSPRANLVIGIIAGALGMIAMIVPLFFLPSPSSGLVLCGRSAGGAPTFDCEENNPEYAAATHITP